MGTKTIYRMVTILGLMAVIAFAVGGLGTVAKAQGGSPNIVDPSTGQPAVGGEPELWVYPTSDPAQDKANVQWAVDHVASGGTVLLKAEDVNGNLKSFDFGTDLVPGTFNINITRSCTLKGEVLKEKYRDRDDPLYGQRMMTTIKNGAPVFGIYGAWDDYANKIEVKIRDLVSRDASLFFIGAYGFCDVEIDNVKVIDLVAHPDHARIAIFAHNHGKFAVSNCMVRMKAAPFAVWLEVGIGYSGLEFSPYPMIGAELEFVNNDIATQYQFGILVEDNAIPDDPKDALIKNNKVASPVGISGGHIYGAFLVAHNAIDSTDMGIFYDDMTNSVLESNNINMADGSIAGIELHSLTSSTTQGNKIAGNGLYGIGLYENSTNNVFMGNNLSAFDEDAFKVYFDDGSVFGEPFPQGNFYVGRGGVVNESAATYNTITGLEPIAGQFNEDEKNAIAEAAQRLSADWPADGW